MNYRVKRSRDLEGGSRGAEIGSRPRSSENKRFGQIIFFVIFSVILLSGSFLLPFLMMKNSKKHKTYGDFDDETSTGQGTANRTSVQRCIAMDELLSTLIKLLRLQFTLLMCPIRIHK